jgi:hypothetical protein
MASMAGQFRQIALRVCDALDAAEASSGPGSYPDLMMGLGEGGLADTLAAAAALRSETETLLAAGAGVVAKLSDRELGYSGLASRKGYRSPVAMIQSITGSSRTEAARQVRLGEAMGEADAARRLAEAATLTDTDRQRDDADLRAVDDDPTLAEIPPVVVPWFEPVTRAVDGHVLTPDGAAAIIQGMGEPCNRCDDEAMRTGVTELLAHVAALTADLEGTALAGTINADRLGKLARQQRDRIDPVGVSERYRTHYQSRTWRFSRSESGQRTAWVQFDDESAMWIDSIVAAGMRPRRGGPRFVDKTEAANAERMKTDPRSNDQLVFDLLMGALRAGAVADPTTAFGNRQPGIRVITTKENLPGRDNTGQPDGQVAGPGFLEDNGDAVAPEILEHMLCDVGTKPVTVDEAGNPLDVGREQRLFTTKQRVALAYRDGGCMDPLCDLQTSYTEAHHIDEWVAHDGKTNIADGVLLCLNSHLRVHNQGWRIIRDTVNVYWMIPPPTIDPEQRPIRMRPKAPWRQTDERRAVPAQGAG